MSKIMKIEETSFMHDPLQIIILKIQCTEFFYFIALCDKIGLVENSSFVLPFKKTEKGGLKGFENFLVSISLGTAK